MFAAYSDQQVVTLVIIAVFVIGGPILVLAGGLAGYVFRKAEMKHLDESGSHRPGMA